MIWWWLGIFSAVTFVGSLLVLPFIVAKIPRDYFIRDEGIMAHWALENPIRALIIRVIKNFSGILLIAAGIAMLVLPGQGLLTILLGLMLVDFPGKRKLELRMVRRPKILSSINWIRDKAGEEPLLVDQAVPSAEDGKE